MLSVWRTDCLAHWWSLKCCCPLNGVATTAPSICRAYSRCRQHKSGNTSVKRSAMASTACLMNTSVIRTCCTLHAIPQQSGNSKFWAAVTQNIGVLKTCAPTYTTAYAPFPVLAIPLTPDPCRALKTLRLYTLKPVRHLLWTMHAVAGISLSIDSSLEDNSNWQVRIRWCVQKGGCSSPSVYPAAVNWVKLALNRAQKHCCGWEAPCVLLTCDSVPACSQNSDSTLLIQIPVHRC